MIVIWITVGFAWGLACGVLLTVCVNYARRNRPVQKPRRRGLWKYDYDWQCEISEIERTADGTLCRVHIDKIHGPYSIIKRDHVGYERWISPKVITWIDPEPLENKAIDEIEEWLREKR